MCVGCIDINTIVVILRTLDRVDVRMTLIDVRQHDRFRTGTRIDRTTVRRGTRRSTGDISPERVQRHLRHRCSQSRHSNLPY